MLFVEAFGAHLIDCYSKFYVLLKKYTCVLCMVPRANNDHFQTQHYIISFRLSYRSGDHLHSHCDPISATKLSSLTDSVFKQTTGLRQYSVQRNPNIANCSTLCPISEQVGFCSPPLPLLQQPAMRLKKTPVRTTSRDTHPVLIRDALLIFLTPRRKHTWRILLSPAERRERLRKWLRQERKGLVWKVIARGSGSSSKTKREKYRKKERKKEIKERHK